MKRVISFFLCLVMCFSLFSSTAVQVSALGAASMLFAVEGDTVKDGKITFKVSLNGGIEGFGGAVVLVEYDNTVLSPVEFAPAYKDTGVQRFNGIYSNGKLAGSDNFYSVGYTNVTPEKISENTEFFNITFEVIGEKRPATSVKFYCREFFSVKNPEQSITVADGLQPIARFAGISTLEAPTPRSATLFTNGITFRWEEVVGVTEYEVIRKTATGEWKTLGRVPADKTYYDDFDLESGNTYIYSVIAVNDSGKSAFDSIGSSCKYVSKPANVTVQNGIGGIDISWNTAKGTDKYQIVRREYGTEEWTVIAEISNNKTSYKDVNVENEKTYEYDVNSIYGNFVTDTVSEGEAVTYLEAPSIISVTNISNGVELKWQNIESVAYYIIYRKVVGVDAEFSVYQANVTSNYFVDTDVEIGKAYTYSVQAVSNLNHESAFTKTGYTITRVPSTVVTELVAQPASIIVTWEAVSNVDGYNIYRKTENSDWEKAGGASKYSTTFEDKQARSGQEYFYCVAPCIGSSESAKVPSFQSIYFLKAPQNVTAVNIKDGIKVSWTASEGAEEYRVYRQNGDKEELVGIVDTGATEFLDYNAQTEDVYCYYVKAAGIKDESFNSEKTANVKRIDCVEKIKTEILYDGILISWEKHAFADLYIVCRMNNGVWTRIAETVDLEYVDTGVESGETYGYTVIPVVSGFEGGIDEEITEFEYLESTSITDKELTTGGIKLYWKKITGAKKYEIQRAPLDSNGKLSGSYVKIATVDADKSSYEDKKVKAGNGYSYRVYAVDGDAKSLASTDCKAVFLATQSIKSLSNAYGGVKITWNASTGAKNYRIYRKENDGEWVFVKKLSGSKRSYVDKGAENGVKTYYAVRAQSGDSISTYKSKSFTYFASPEVTVANNTSAITVTWDKIGGAKSYYVYRKAPGDDSWKRVSTVTKNIYTDRDVKNGKIYRYTVKAYNGDILSAYNTDGWKIKRLPAPALKTVKNTKSGIKISWAKATGASKYVVMRKANGVSKWEEIKTTTSLSFTDKTAQPGKIYTYTVKAGYSDYRSTYSASGLKMQRIETPALSSVKSAKKGVTFKWKEVEGVSGYLVYRKTGSGDWEEIAKVRGASTLSYVDKTAKKGKTYYYSVRAYSGSYKSGYNTTGLKIKDKY